MVKEKYECKCGRKMTGHSMRNYKDQFLCYVCYKKKFRSLSYNKISKEEAIGRTYEVRAKNGGGHYLSPSLPNVLVGMKFKMVEVD